MISDIIEWDINTWSKAITFWDKNVQWDTIQNGLELGAWEGGLSLWLALKGKNVVCSDLRHTKEHATPLHSKYDVSSLISYQDIDASNIPYEDFFDVIVFKSIIGGIGRNNNYDIQAKVFREILKALKPGGKLLFAENLIGSYIHQKLRKKFVKWGDSWRYISIRETKEFLKEFSHYDLRTTGVIGAFGRNEKQRKFLSYFDIFLLNKICSSNWKYVIYGIAEK